MIKCEIYTLMRQDEIEEEIAPFCSDGCVESYAENQGIKKYDVNICSEEASNEYQDEECGWCKSPCG